MSLGLDLNDSGYISVIKPKGWSSNQLLSKLKWLFQIKKAGHGGTLDPFATGIVPVFFGESTKFSNRILESNKEYIAELKLGFESSTGDTEGEITKDSSFDNENLPRNLKNILNEFIGVQKQTPPKYSALKYNGKPYYEYARAGIEIPLKKREIEIFSIDLVNFTNQQITFQVSCSKGTYIRTLGEDIAKKIGTKGYLTNLERIRVGTIKKIDSFSVEQIEELSIDNRKKLLKPIYELLELPKIQLNHTDTTNILNGQNLVIEIESGEILLFSEKNFIGIGISDGKIIKPVRLIRSKIN
ncbi:MAG: tRNA pseudouridine(55) synthase TruB [Methylophilaceae bacterium]|jgi:tRNA pseudouridine55 synthase